jgi:hypothetical protein
LVCSAANLGLKPGHFSVTTGVIRNRTIRIGGQRKAQCRQHAHRRHPNTVQSHQRICCASSHVITDHNTEQNDQHRSAAGAHTQGQTFDHGGCGTCVCLFRDLLGWGKRMRGVILSQLAYGNTDQQAGQDNDPHCKPVGKTNKVKNRQ